MAGQNPTNGGRTMMTTTTTASLETRVAGLERSNRRWMRATFGLLVGGAVAVLTGAARRGGDESLAVKALYVVDDKGEARVMIAGGTSSWGPHITMTDSNDRGRLALFIGRDGRPAVHLRGADEKTRISLTLGADDAPLVRITGRDGKALRSTP